jgi:DNA/RNA-binding domain of Phe-tRNA-synthetase-like protein
VNERNLLLNYHFHFQGKTKGKMQLLPIVGRRCSNGSGMDYPIDHPLFLKLQQTYGDSPPSEIPLLTHARNFFRGVGLDPTRNRPSSEALIRRIIKGNDFPVVNRLVDLANFASVDSGLPVGLYDRYKLHGDSLYMRIGKEGDTYEGIGRGVISLENKPVFFDRRGPFGSPISDSVRASVTEDTRNFLLIFYAPIDLPRKELMQHGAVAAERMLNACGGEIEVLGIIG